MAVILPICIFYKKKLLFWITFHWIYLELQTVNIGSGYGLLSSENKSWTEPMLTKIHDSLRRHMATMW